MSSRIGRTVIWLFVGLGLIVGTEMFATGVGDMVPWQVKVSTVKVTAEAESADEIPSFHMNRQIAPGRIVSLASFYLFGTIVGFALSRKRKRSPS